MSLIKCSECSAEISDKASRCPKCGAPVVVHEWRCSKCGNMISEEPCPHCSKAQTAVNTNTVGCANSVGTTPAFVAKKKSDLGVLITFLVIAAFAIIFAVNILLLQDCSNHNKNKGTVVYGIVNDWYDDDGDGWVDRFYDKVQNKWYLDGPYPNRISEVQ